MTSGRPGGPVSGGGAGGGAASGTSSGAGWFTALILFTIASQAAFNGIRVLVAYRTIELGGSAAMLGVMTAAYSLMPLLAAIAIGRLVDRGYSTLVLWLGTAMLVVPAALTAWAPQLWILVLTNMALGLGQLLATVASQALIPLSFPADELNRRFGWLTLGVSGGQLIGVPLAGFVAGAQGPEPHIRLALWVMAGVACLAVPFVGWVMVRGSSEHISRAEARSHRQSPLEILATPGMKPAIYASMATLAAVDIMTAYLPLIGTSTGMAVWHVTLLLTLRTLSSLVSRFFIGALTAAVPQRVLLWGSSLAAGVSVILIPVLPSFWFLAVLMVVCGFAFGLTQPLTMTWVSTVADPSNRAAVLSIRLAGNRLSQVAIPSLAAALAVVAPAGSVFVLTGAMLVSAAASTAASSGGGGRGGGGSRGRGAG